MHVILDRVEGHDLLHVKWLRQITRLHGSVKHACIAEHHLWGCASWYEELLLLLPLEMWRGHSDRLLLWGLARIFVRRQHASFFDYWGSSTTSSQKLIH